MQEAAPAQGAERVKGALETGPRRLHESIFVWNVLFAGTESLSGLD